MPVTNTLELAPEGYPVTRIHTGKTNDGGLQRDYPL